MKADADLIEEAVLVFAETGPIGRDTAIDAIREEVVTSLRLGLGPELNLLSWGPDHARTVSTQLRQEAGRAVNRTPGPAPLEAEHKGVETHGDCTWLRGT